MTDRFQNKYRVPSSRLQHWDYRNDAIYFVTICTQNKTPYFGEVADSEMQLSNVGIIADVMWHEINHHAKNVELDAFVVMPNHVHGIIILTGNDFNDAGDDVHETLPDGVVETLHATSLRKSSMASISPKSNSLSTIIRSYKSAVSKHAHRLGFEFEWQPRFHDHIIRHDKSYNQIKQYIHENPRKWDKDKFNPLVD